MAHDTDPNRVYNWTYILAPSEARARLCLGIGDPSIPSVELVNPDPDEERKFFAVWPTAALARASDYPKLHHRPLDPSSPYEHIHVKPADTVAAQLATLDLESQEAELESQLEAVRARKAQRAAKKAKKAKKAADESAEEKA